MKLFSGLPRITNGRKQNCFNRQATAWIHYSLPDGKETTAHLKFPIYTERCTHTRMLNLGKVTAATYGTGLCHMQVAQQSRNESQKLLRALAQLPPEDKYLK